MKIIECPDCRGKRHLPGGPLPGNLQQDACPRCSGYGHACGEKCCLGRKLDREEGK